MKKDFESNSSNKSSLFLMEMIVATFFFSFTCTICAIVFVHSFKTQKKSIELSNSNTFAENISQLLLSESGNLGILDEKFKGYIIKPDNSNDNSECVYFYFDENFNLILENDLKNYTNIRYQLLVTQNIQDANKTYKTADNPVIEGKSVVYNIYVFEKNDLLNTLPKDNIQEAIYHLSFDKYIN